MIAVTSLPHSAASPSRHSSGKRLFELADIVIDTRREIIQLVGEAQQPLRAMRTKARDGFIKALRDAPMRDGSSAFELRDARPFATRGPTTREGVGLKSGALLVREWNGRLERVMILDDGCAWNGCLYRSLSQVAKAITGTNWNGHRFFGLKAVRTGTSNRKRNWTAARRSPLRRPKN